MSASPWSAREHKTKGIRLVIDKDTPAFLRQAGEKLGWNASPTTQVIFEDARVPANRVGDEGEVPFAMMGLDGGRLNIGAATGRRAALPRRSGGLHQGPQAVRPPIADFQNTQFMLADMATDLEAAARCCISQRPR